MGCLAPIGSILVCSLGLAEAGRITHAIENWKNALVETVNAMYESDSKVYISAEVMGVRRLYEDLFNDQFRRLSVREQLQLQAQHMLDAHQSGDRTVATHIRCWHPALVGHSVEEVMACEFTLQDARETIAREFGFSDWADVHKRGTETPDPVFESAVDAMLGGDADALRRLLEARPSLVRERSAYGPRSTLLHYCGSNGVETYRQVVPGNLAQITQLLLDAGANVNASAEMYGGGCTTIALLISSAHPAEAGVVDDVVRILVDGGAESDNS